MKKAGNIIVIFFLLIATGGIPITRHYCGQSMVSSSIFSTTESCCGKDCSKCHNEFSFKKLIDDFTVSSFDARQSVVNNSILLHFIAELSAPLPATPLAATLTPRKFLNFKTGDIPVTFGNFRC